MVRCPFCGSQMNWNSDFNYDEVYGEGEGVVSFYSCMSPFCNADAQFSVRTDEEKENE